MLGDYMKFTTIFFDRDDTLVYNCPDKAAWRDAAISDWSCKPFIFSYEKMYETMKLAGKGYTPWYKDVQTEREFFLRYYKYLLINEGVKGEVDIRAEILLNELWCNNELLLFPETIEVLGHFKQKGYKIGVISNTSPSLKITLQQAGIADYFTSFTASSLAGASKPSPIIYNAALEAQGVTAEECIFVDDKDYCVQGARDIGMTAFNINRGVEISDNEWVIRDLKDLIRHERIMQND